MKQSPSFKERLFGWYPKLLTGASAVGLVASFWQAAERVHMLKNPTVDLSCNLNPIIDCSGVLGNRWAALFGFPNAFLGIVMFSFLFASGVLLWSGGVFTKKYQAFVQAVNTILILFSVWFFGMSLYVIGRVCLFCIFIWAVSVPLFWYGSLYAMAHQTRQSGAVARILRFAQKNHLLVVLTVYAVMLGLYFLRFSEYYWP